MLDFGLGFFGRKFTFLDNGVLNLLVKLKKKKKILICIYDTLGFKGFFLLLLLFKAL